MSGENTQEFANPNGIPDWRLSQNEAALWLLTQRERAHGETVRFDEDTHRWVRAAGVRVETSTAAVCESCGKAFTARRSTAKWCSRKCEGRGARRAVRGGKSA